MGQCEKQKKSNAKVKGELETGASLVGDKFINMKIRWENLKKKKSALT